MLLRLRYLYFFFKFLYLLQLSTTLVNPTMVLTKLITGLIKRDGDKLVERWKWTERPTKIKQNDVLALIAVHCFSFLIPGLVMHESVSLTSDRIINYDSLHQKLSLLVPNPNQRTECCSYE